jgi:hypothetical protein
MITNEPVGGYSPLVEELSPGVLRNIPLLQILPWRQSLWNWLFVAKKRDG